MISVKPTIFKSKSKNFNEWIENIFNYIENRNKVKFNIKQNDKNI